MFNRFAFFIFIFFAANAYQAAANIPGRPGSDRVQCLQRTGYFISNPADREAVCDCVMGVQSGEACKQWEIAIQRLETADYTVPPPPVPVHTPDITACVSRAARLPDVTKPSERTELCECMAGLHNEAVCAKWKDASRRLLLADYPSAPPPAPPDRTPSIEACMKKVVQLPDLTETRERTEVCECAVGIKSEAQCARWKDAVRRLTLGDYSMPATANKPKKDSSTGPILFKAAAGNKS